MMTRPPVKQMFVPHAGEWAPAHHVLFEEGMFRRSMNMWIEQLRKKCHPNRVAAMVRVEFQRRREEDE